VDAILAAFQGFIDYAGLYPPAGLDLGQVVQNYAAYRAGAASWMLGRLIVPLDRLDQANDLAKAAGATPSEPWPTSVLVGDALGASTKSARLTGFRSRTDVVLSAESIETSASTVEEIGFLARSYPIYVERFIEIPADPEPTPLLAAIAGAACSAKDRSRGAVSRARTTNGHFGQGDRGAASRHSCRT
jgi:hypothetical protein